MNEIKKIHSNGVKHASTCFTPAAWPPPWLTESAAETSKPAAPAVTSEPAEAARSTAPERTEDYDEIAPPPPCAVRFAGLVGNPDRKWRCQHCDSATWRRSRALLGKWGPWPCCVDCRNERPKMKHAIPSELKPDNVTAVIDTREQRPLDLAPLRTEAGSLVTGDYSVKGLESVVAVERKSLPDLLACIGQERERFDREVQRLLAYPCRAIVIEAAWSDLENGGWRSQVTPAAAVGSVLGWIAAGIPVIMAGDHARAGRYVSRLLFTAARRRWREARSLVLPIVDPAQLRRPKPAVYTQKRLTAMIEAWKLNRYKPRKTAAASKGNSARAIRLPVETASPGGWLVFASGCSRRLRPMSLTKSSTRETRGKGRSELGGQAGLGISLRCRRKPWTWTFD